MGAKGISGRLTRRLLLGALLSSAAGVTLAGAPLTSVRPVARARGQWKPDVRGAGDLIAEARLGGKIGFVVADARTGETLESHNPLLALPPASVAKTFTTLYALKELGPRHRFTTRLIATGPVEGGRLNGDLILAGGGDPTLDTDALADMAEKLKNAGIREIAGRFLAYSEKLPTIFSIDPDQPDQMGYNPSVSGLNLNYNRVHFKWKRESGEYAVTLDAPAHKFSPLVRIARMRIVDRSMPVYTYADNGGADQWTVARAALGKAGSRWLPVRKPELYAAEVFKTLARSYGVVLPNAGVAHAGHAGRALVSRESPVLHDILRDMLYWSTNLTAEVVGLTSTLADGEGARTLKASASAMSAWAKSELGTRKTRFVDHSGLSDQSRVAASDMVRALVHARATSGLPAILKAVPMRDDKGQPFPDHPIKVHAKTGTLNFVSALAGYMTGAQGRELAFAIFTAEPKRRAAGKRNDGEVPPGARAWKGRSRRLQMQLIERWGVAYPG